MRGDEARCRSGSHERLRHNKECIAPLHDERYSFKKSIAYWAESIEPFAEHAFVDAVIAAVLGMHRIDMRIAAAEKHEGAGNAVEVFREILAGKRPLVIAQRLFPEELFHAALGPIGAFLIVGKPRIARLVGQLRRGAERAGRTVDQAFQAFWHGLAGLRRSRFAPCPSDRPIPP